MAGLDNLGSNDRGDKVTLSATAKKLVEIAGYLISEAGKNLDKKGNVATGGLRDKIYAEDIEVNGMKMSIDIMIPEYGMFVDQGVKGVEGGTGKYQFRSKRPSIGMKNAIKAWLRLRGRRDTKYKAISKTESKDKKIARMRKATDTTESLAWAVATSIKKKGIKPTKFFSNAVKSAEKTYKKEIAAGFKLDIINSLK
jgi:hypothetical protein